MSTCHRRKAGRKRCRVGMMSLATSCDITRHHAIGSGSGSGAGGVRRHSTEGVAEEGRGGGSRKRKRKTSGRRKRKGFPLQNLYTEYPYLNLCEDNWKVTYLASRVLSTLKTTLNNEEPNSKKAKKEEPDEVKSESIVAQHHAMLPPSPKTVNDGSVVPDTAVVPAAISMVMSSRPSGSPPPNLKHKDLETTSGFDQPANKHLCHGPMLSIIPATLTPRFLSAPAAVAPTQSLSVSFPAGNASAFTGSLEVGSEVLPSAQPRKPLRRRVPSKMSVADAQLAPEVLMIDDILSEAPRPRPKLVYRAKKQQLSTSLGTTVESAAITNTSPLNVAVPGIVNPVVESTAPVSVVQSQVIPVETAGDNPVAIPITNTSPLNVAVPGIVNPAVESTAPMSVVQSWVTVPVETAGDNPVAIPTAAKKPAVYPMVGIATSALAMQPSIPVPGGPVITPVESNTLMSAPALPEVTISASMAHPSALATASATEPPASVPLLVNPL